ncbi:hypothetical protein LZ32DRAFT_254884 [Colletotrichum eremochloae]|nr:hypothetical protein LZ32DRAFT_254884 [Colletotrichum eremochloae]
MLTTRGILQRSRTLVTTITSDSSFAFHSHQQRPIKKSGSTNHVPRSHRIDRCVRRFATGDVHANDGQTSVFVITGNNAEEKRGFPTFSSAVSRQLCATVELCYLGRRKHLLLASTDTTVGIVDMWHASQKVGEMPTTSATMKCCGQGARKGNKLTAHYGWARMLLRTTHTRLDEPCWAHKTVRRRSNDWAPIGQDGERREPKDREMVDFVISCSKSQGG